MLRFLLCISVYTCVSSAPTFLQGDSDKNRLMFGYIASRGFIDEFHSIYSADGYQTGIHRIVNPLRPISRYPILFVPLVGGASVEFVRADVGGYVNESLEAVGPNIGFELAKRGYDVWLLDWRGTYFYSYNHTKYNIDADIEYWDFSEDDLAIFDMPAAVDYIRKYTNRQKIGLFPFQTSSRLYFYLSSFVNRFNTVVQPVVCVNPVFSLANRRSNKEMDRAMFEMQIRKRGAFLPEGLQLLLISSMCNFGFSQLLICNPLMYFILLLFFPQGQVGSLNIQRLSVYAATGFNHGMSRWSVAQFSASALSDRLTMLDIGPEVNMGRYGSIKPPEYFPEKITNSEMHLIYSPYDLFYDAVDVQVLKQRLGTHLRSELVIPTQMSAISYLDGESGDIIKWVNIPVLNIFNAYR